MLSAIRKGKRITFDMSRTDGVAGEDAVDCLTLFLESGIEVPSIYVHEARD